MTTKVRHSFPEFDAYLKEVTLDKLVPSCHPCEELLGVSALSLDNSCRLIIEDNLKLKSADVSSVSPTVELELWSDAISKVCCNGVLDEEVQMRKKWSLGDLEGEGCCLLTGLNCRIRRRRRSFRRPLKNALALKRLIWLIYLRGCGYFLL